MKRFSSFDGVEIAYDVLGEGDAVLLHHGFASDSKTNWLRPGVAQAVRESGRQALLIDARGHGESGKPHDPACYANGAMERDVRCLLDLLGVEHAHFVGYSMGSFIGMRLAPDDPRLLSLVLGGVGLDQIRTWRPEDATQIAEALEAPSTVESANAMARAFRSFADATRADRIALAAVQRSGDLVPGPEHLARIAIPTLVLNGDRDVLAGAPQPLAEAIPGAQGASVPGNHLSAVVQPEFRRAVVRFLDSVPGW